MCTQIRNKDTGEVMEDPGGISFNTKAPSVSGKTIIANLSRLQSAISQVQTQLGVKPVAVEPRFPDEDGLANELALWMETVDGQIVSAVGRIDGIYDAVRKIRDLLEGEE